MLLWCLLGSIHLDGMHREPAVATEVLPAANNAYCARATARFPKCDCIPRLNTINPLCLVAAIMFLFFVAQSHWESRTNPKFGP